MLSLEERAPLLQSAVDQTHEAVMITEGAPLDEPGPRILYVNAAFTDITGYDTEEVIGRSPRFLQGPKTEPWVIRRLRNKLEQGRSFEGEAINYRKDGSPYVNQWSISPVENDEGVITHWVSVQRDVTDQRRMNERLLQVQEEERYRIAQRIHDNVGGLLTSLQMTVDRAKTKVRDTGDENLAQLCNEVESQIDDLSTTVRTLTEKESPHLLKDYGLSKAIPKLIETFETTNEIEFDLHNEIKLNERLSSLLERIVYRILREALSNIIHHANTEHAQVVLNKFDKKLRLHIIDYGTGFSMSDEHHDADRLGLTGIRERVQRLNGTFTLSTTPGEGTRMTVTLPLSLVDPPE